MRNRVMRNKVDYEWDVEVLDENGEIADHHFQSSAKNAVREAKQSMPCEIVLVRSEGNEDEGITGRLWAYVKDGKLPECFEDSSRHELPGYPVPKKFHTELAKALKEA